VGYFPCGLLPLLVCKRILRLKVNWQYWSLKKDTAAVSASLEGLNEGFYVEETKEYPNECPARIRENAFVMPFVRRHYTLAHSKRLGKHVSNYVNHRWSKYERAGDASTGSYSARMQSLL